MKDKIFGVLQRVGRSFMLPIDRISKMQEAFLRQLTKELEEHALRTVSGEDTPHREQCEEETEQVPETDMSDAMMSMALAMGE